MNGLLTIAQLLLLLTYAGATFVYLRYFLRRSPELRKLCRPTLLFTLSLHAVYLGLVAVAQGWLPLVGPGQGMTCMVFAIMAMYLIIEWRTGLRVMGLFVLIPAFVFQLLSIFLMSDMTEVPETLRSGRLPAHALPALLGYAGLSLGTVFSALLLLLRTRIKERQIGMLYRRLPSLRILDTMAFHANVMGFSLLTLGIATGCLWAAFVWQSDVLSDPKLVSTAVVWVLYLLYVASYWIPGWSRRSRNLLALVNFTVLTFSFVIVGLLVESQHSW